MIVHFSEWHVLLKIRLGHAWYQMKEHVIHILSIFTMSEIVSLNHGSGGKKAHELIRNDFAKKFGMLSLLLIRLFLNRMDSFWHLQLIHMLWILCFSRGQYRKTCCMRNSK